MNVLSARPPQRSVVTGDVLMNGAAFLHCVRIADSLITLGHSYDKKRLKKVSGYVLQDDLLLPYLTVRYIAMEEPCPIPISESAFCSLRDFDYQLRCPWRRRSSGYEALPSLASPPSPLPSIEN
jgi:hypothetical protein